LLQGCCSANVATLVVFEALWTATLPDSPTTLTLKGSIVKWPSLHQVHRRRGRQRQHLHHHAQAGLLHEALRLTIQSDQHRAVLGQHKMQRHLSGPRTRALPGNRHLPPGWPLLHLARSFHRWEPPLRGPQRQDPRAASPAGVNRAWQIRPSRARSDF